MALQETDRVPLYDLLRCDAVIEHFSGERIPRPSTNPEIAEKLFRMVGKAISAMLDMTRSVGFGPLMDQEWVDDLGFVWRSSRREKTSWIVKRPFEEESGAIEFIKGWIQRIKAGTKELRSNRNGFRERYHREFMRIQEAIGDTINLLAEQGVGLDDIRHRLGIELFSYVEKDDPGLISEFLDVYTEHAIEVCHAIADRSLSPAVMTYGDIACKGKLLHSPDFLRREFFPRLKKLNDAWHEHGFKVLFHSDGYIMDVIEDLIDAGIDGLNPIETVAGMSLKELKERYGDRIFLAGGIDMSQLLSNGTPEEVREECRRAIEIAYPGYFMGSTTELDNAVKLENVLAMYEVAMESAKFLGRS